MALLKNPYACAFCHESFINAKTLVSHVQIIHEPAKPNDKDQINIRIKTSTNKTKTNTFERTKRIEPIVTENKEEKFSKFSCSKCPKSFRTRNLFTHHFKLHGERKHSCKICSKKFHLATSLKYHMRIHTG